MNAKDIDKPIIVPLREAAGAFLSYESAIADEATAEGGEGALALAAIGRTLRKIQDSEEEVESDAALATVRSAPISRLQSLIASGEAAEVEIFENKHGNLEAKFDTKDVLGWAQVVWQKIRHPIKHDLMRAASAPESFPNSGRVALLSDWGTGLYGCPVSAQTITDDSEPFAMTMHLGDIYYSGTPKETKNRFLDLWPSRPEAVHRALNGNHEMYSGGYGYFDDILPRFDQKASYFAHQNDHWILVGLDVAYKDHMIDSTQLTWLKDIIDQAEDRKVILFSHHQLFSHYESNGKKLWENYEFQQLLKSGKIFAWYWGHEHRCCLFEPHEETGILARSIGHSGMPQSRKKTRDLPTAAGVGNADWRRAAATVRKGMAVPESLILEGPNPYIPGEEEKFLPNGHVVLNFDGAKLTEQICQPDGTLIYENDLT